MRKYIFIGFFSILVLAGIALAGYFLFCLKEKDWSIFIFSALSALIGSGGLIWKNSSSPSSNQKTTPKDMPPNNLPTWNRRFVGRKKLLDDIHKAFKKKKDSLLVQAQVITGMGGIGKTETAKEYAYRYRKEYKYIWWVNAENDSRIESDYLIFAQINKLCLPEDNVIAHVKDWMKKNSHWLFIFDNVEDEKTLEKYCASSGLKRQHIIVTTRNTHFLNHEPFKINLFTELESCTFIEKYTKIPADEYFKKLAYLMGYLPLALDHAGAYLAVNKDNGVNYKDYLEFYEINSLEMFYSDDPEKKTVANTWKISFMKIKNQASHQLINLCAYFAPENISIQWFKNAIDVLPDELREAVKNDYKFNNAISELTKYSLITLDNNGNMHIHRLVQEVIKANLKEEQSLWRGYALQILDELRFFEFHTAELRALFTQLVPHIETLTKDIINEEETEEVANLYYFLGKGFYELADYPQSLKWHEKSLSISKNILGEKHKDTATSYNEIALVYDNQGDYDKALEYYRKAIAIREKVQGTEHPDTATTYLNMANVYYAQGDYNKALEYNGKDLAISEKVLGKEHPDTATTYNNMAVVYDNQGDYDKALEYNEKALSICEKVLGKEHPDTATTYNNMAGDYQNQGDYNKALEYYEKALAIFEKVLGIEHPNTANTYNNIAFVYREQKNYNLALEYFVKSLIINKKVLGDEHPDTKNTFESLEITYEESGNREPFEAWRKRTVGW